MTLFEEVVLRRIIAIARQTIRRQPQKRAKYAKTIIRARRRLRRGRA